jgi:SAM-dependent methyltransferase
VPPRDRDAGVTGTPGGSGGPASPAGPPKPGRSVPPGGPAGGQGYVVYFTKGLADVVTGELTALVPGLEITATAERFAIIVAGPPEVRRLLARGRTIDDLRLLAAGPEPVPDADSFAGLCTRAAAATRAYLADHDPQRAGHEPWSVTVSARQPPWRAGGWDPAPVIAARLGGADLHGTERRDVDLRIQADGELMHIAASPAARPPGKRESGPARPGALRPSVAAALVRLALHAAVPDASRHGLYDPCCGTGTVAAEAARLALPVYASDIDPEAVTLTAARLARLAGTAPPPRPPRVFRHDVLRPVPRDIRAAIVASNLPWGKQIRLPREGELFDAIATLVAPRLAAGGGCALLTTSGDRLAARIRRRAPDARISIRRIGLLGQTPAIVIAGPELAGM